MGGRLQLELLGTVLVCYSYNIIVTIDAFLTMYDVT